MDFQQRAQMYLDYLTAEGYRPERQGDGLVQFKAEGRAYYTILDKDDLGRNTDRVILTLSS